MNFCQGKQDITPRLSPCDGTANSSAWCCGETADCCQTGNGVITLQQVFGRLSSTVSSTLSLTTTTTTSTTGSSSDPGVQRPNKIGAGEIAGITIGAVAGLAMVVAAVFLIRKTSRKKQAVHVQPSFAEAPHGAAMHEMGPTTKYTHVRELPG